MSQCPRLHGPGAICPDCPDDDRTYCIICGDVELDPDDFLDDEDAICSGCFMTERAAA